MRAIVATLLVASLLAGCSSGDDGPVDPDPHRDPPSPAEHAILPPEAVWVASTQDGKRMFNAVYRPDTEEPVPVFINFSPYWADSAMAEGDPFAHYMVQEYVPRGYAVVLSAVRGTGHSEGCFQIGGDLELQDAYDVVDFFASEPWSSGSVAAGGKSYDSTTQNGMVAKFPHPALKGIFHVSGITDMYRYSYREGVPYENGLQFTPRYFATQGLDEYVGTPDLDGEDQESLLRILDDAACVEAPKHVVSGEGSAASGLKDAYWQERDWNRYLPDSTWNGSIFFVHGLQDWNVKPDHILPWLGIVQQKGLPVLGWLHQDTYNQGHVYPMRADWNATMLAWLDWTLKGADNGFEARLGVEAQGTDGIWRRSDAWPPAPDATAAPTVLEFLPAAPTASWTAPEATRFAGALAAEVEAIAATPDPVLSVVLEVDGAWVGEAVLRGIYRDGLDEPAPVTAVPTTYRLESYPVDLVVPKGATLTATLMAPPREAMDLSSGTRLVEAHGAVVLQAVDAEAALDPQPTATSCWAC